MLTIETIRAAQSTNDPAAQEAVLEWLDSRIDYLSRFAVRHVYYARGAWSSCLADEFVQIGRVAAWEALNRFTDDTVEKFEAYAYLFIEGRLKDAVREEVYGDTGVGDTSMKIFAEMVVAAGGDGHKAKEMAQTVPPKGRRLSKERAEAAYLAWTGTVSVNVNSRDGDNDERSATVADMLTHVDEAPDGTIRPKVGHGAAIEALKVLRRYAGIRLRVGDPRNLADDLPTLVEILDDTVRVPADPAERRYVLDAMAILYSAVSTATDSAIADDLRTADDARWVASRERHERVTDCLADMGEHQRNVLRHSFGIGGASDYGWGDGSDMHGLAEATGLTYSQAKSYRTKAKAAFAKRYVAAVRLTNPARADELAIGAAEGMKRGGRK